jgi:hypothetical protein
MPFKSITNLDLVEHRKKEIQKIVEREEDIKLDRVDITHHSCKCSEGAIWWQRGRKDREAYLSNQTFMHPIDPTLQPIAEGEEEAKEREESDWPIRGNITMVVGDVEPCVEMDGEKQETPMVFLTTESKDTRVQCFLDSGANSHMFNTTGVFVQIGTKQTNLITACKGEKATASKGTIKNLSYNTGTQATLNNTGVYCNSLVENLLSVGKLCDIDQTVVFDQHGYVIFKGNVSATGVEVHAQNRDPLTGLYPIHLKIDGTDISSAGNSLDTSKDRQIYFSSVGELRENFSHISSWARNVCRHKNEREYTDDERRVDSTNNNNVICNLARFYVKEGTTDMERWHSKLGHVGTKIIKECKIPNLKIPNTPFRCEHCIRGKMHTGNHSTKTTGRTTDLKPGEYIITDLQGPYVRDRYGNKYSQIFLDVVSKTIWVVRLRKKKHSDDAIRKVLLDAKVRSRNSLRILRTDGDGIFGRSRNFQELREKEGFIHERPPPYDHQQSAIVDRECRTLLEGVSTALDQSGAPPNFWGEAADHFIFTRNILPRVEVRESAGGKTMKSPSSVLENRKIDFNLKHLVAFGTQVTCYLPHDRREGKKTPGQAKSYDGIVLGYVLDMQAYIVWDIKERKKREVSFFHSIVHEGFYPFREKLGWSEEEKRLPRSFTPFFEDLLTPEEFKKYSFSEKEEKEILDKYFSREEVKEEREEKKEIKEVEREEEKKEGVDEMDGKHVDDEPPRPTPPTPEKKEEKKEETHKHAREEKKEETHKSVYTLPPMEKKRTHADFWKHLLEERITLGEREPGKEVARESEKKTPTLIPEKTETSREKRARLRSRAMLVASGPETPGPDEAPPTTLGHAKKGRFWPGYERAIEEEMGQLEKNGTWEYVDRSKLPYNLNILRSKFVFDIKRGARGEFIKYKARFVYTQIEGVDYFDTYASVMNTKSFRILLTIYNSNKDMTFRHWDVKQAFVNAPLEEEVYVHQIKGFERKGKEGKVLRLIKALYGTKQAAHAWQTFLRSILVGEGGRQNLKDECVYIFREGEAVCIIGTHVDDLFVLCNSEGEKIRERILSTLRQKMEVDDRGEIKYALDTHIEADREEGVLRISQEKYINNMINEFNLQHAEGKETPAPLTEITEHDLPTTQDDIDSVAQLPIRNAIGKLWWAALISRPDITCALHKCAAWQNKPSHKLWRHILWIMKYLKHTIKYAIVYKRKRQDVYNSMYIAFCDASFATETNSRSRYGYIFYVLGGLVSWTSVHTTRVLTSSTEAECHSVVHTAKENTWIRDFMKELGLFRCDEPTIIFQDNMGAIALMKGGGKHKRSKHFTIEFDALREYVREKEIDIRYVETTNMTADIFTKILPKHLFEKHRNTMMEKGAEGERTSNTRDI